MEHHGDYLGALRRHISGTAARYGNIGAPLPQLDDDQVDEQAAPAPHPLDQMEVEQDGSD